jgi:hypothetical protein
LGSLVVSKQPVGQDVRPPLQPHLPFMHVSPGLQVALPHITPPPELEAELDVEPVEVEVVEVVEVDVVEVELDVDPPMLVPVDVLAPVPFAPPVPRGSDVPEALAPPQPALTAIAKPATRTGIQQGLIRNMPSTSALEVTFLITLHGSLAHRKPMLRPRAVGALGYLRAARTSRLSVVSHPPPRTTRRESPQSSLP